MTAPSGAELYREVESALQDFLQEVKDQRAQRKTIEDCLVNSETALANVLLEAKQVAGLRTETETQLDLIAKFWQEESKQREQVDNQLAEQRQAAAKAVAALKSQGVLAQQRLVTQIKNLENQIVEALQGALDSLKGHDQRLETIEHKLALCQNRESLLARRLKGVGWLLAALALAFTALALKLLT